MYWDINYVLKCLTAHCEAHRPPIENQCFHQVQWLTLPKPLSFHIGQNACLPSFYVIFTSTHDDLVEMTRHGRWIITNGSSDQCNGWLQLKTNAVTESNGWLFKSHFHSTLAKMVAYQWELIREGCKKKTSLLMDNSIMENIWWGPDWPTKEWLWIFHQYIATQALEKRRQGS